MKRCGEEQQIVWGGTTFLIRVQYCQNSSWQGTIQWLDKKVSLPFRSALELMMLIQEALDKADASAADAPPVTWRDKESTG